MTPIKIQQRIEALLVEDAEIWQSIDPAEIANQLRGKPLSDPTYHKILRSREIKKIIGGLDLQLYNELEAQARREAAQRPTVEVPLH